MSARHYPTSPLLGACTAIWRGEKILLARRSVSPNAGTWAMPGGLVEVGETVEDAARREVLEETRLAVERLAFNRFFEIILRDADNRVERHYVLAMFVAISPAGLAVAGDDAAAVGWFTLGELDTIPLTANTLELVHESRAFLPGLEASDQKH
ncbi:MAG: NUDIX domain-containing protein [Pseudomonadota bacterium]